MLMLDKVQLLEERIKKAVALIDRLRAENSSLQEEVNILKMHNDELKDYASSFNNNNKLIEDGITKALHHLDEIDDIVIIDENDTDEFNEAENFASHDASDLQLDEDMLDPDDLPSFDKKSNRPLY